MHKYIVISVTALVLAACGGKDAGENIIDNNKSKMSKTSVSKQLETSCEHMASMNGKTAPKGACKCMSATLMEALTPEQVKTVATAFGKMKTPEDGMTHMMPLLANGEIMKGLKAVEEKCDMK